MEYLKGTFEQITAYNEQVTQGENYKTPTTQWAEPLQIGEHWYILKNEKYPSDLETVNELPKTIDLENETI